MTLRELIVYGEAVLREAGIDDYSNDVRVLAMHVMGIDYTGLILKMQDNESCDEEECFRKYIELRSTHIPCQYIIGSQNFMGYVFKVAENVLIPRQETELLVEEVLRSANDIKSCRVLDVCCGSGCIGISFALKRREGGFKDDKVVMLDISEAAILLSEENNLSLGAGCDIIKSDLFCNVEERYNIIVSNPPYIKSSVIEELMEEVRSYEPRLALDGKEDGLYFYIKIIKEARKYLYEDGMLLLEIGYDQFEDVRKLLIDEGYFDIRLIKDYAGLDRVVTAKI